MKDHSAGGITDAEAQVLLRELARKTDLPGFEFYTGVSYRNLLVYRGHEEFDVTTKPPHEFPGGADREVHAQGARAARSSGKSSTARRSCSNGHEINEVRRQTGPQSRRTQVWLWGQGHAPAMSKFKEKFRVDRGVMITGVDLLRGLAVLLGWENLAVEGMTSFHDTNYVGQGKATAAALDQYDIVFSHIEAPDEASHQAGLEDQGRIDRGDRQAHRRAGAGKTPHVSGVADPRHAGPSDQHRDKKTRVRADPLRHGRHAG
jgi:2,3-bisphosphoglycerate-independent phosphoglycerate mutase